MSKKNRPRPEDLALFLDAIKGTRPIISNKIIIKKPTPKKILPVEKKTLEGYFPHDETEASVKGDDYIQYKHPSISNKILRKLRKGQYNVEAKLDLHGMVVEEARIAVNNFILQALAAQCRVVLIIHGKGRHNNAPILKNKINQWLRHLPTVLAFCTANLAHGSSGAIYVLLKRTREEN